MARFFSSLWLTWFSGGGFVLDSAAWLFWFPIGSMVRMMCCFYRHCIRKPLHQWFFLKRECQVYIKVKGPRRPPIYNETNRFRYSLESVIRPSSAIEAAALSQALNGLISSSLISGKSAASRLTREIISARKSMSIFMWPR